MAIERREPVHDTPLPLIFGTASARSLRAQPSERRFWTSDPRTDLATDSRWWTELLARTYQLDGDVATGLFGALHGMRCLGAQLERTFYGFRLRPGELSKSEYAVCRRDYLAARAGKLRELLVKLDSGDAQGLVGS